MQDYLNQQLWLCICAIVEKYDMYTFVIIIFLTVDQI